MKRHLILVGLSGSGKSTVGRRAAELLGAAFADIDEIVASAVGTSIADFFAAQGEARFRQLERAAMDGALAAPPHVIAPGAGWMAEPGNLERAQGALLVYLEVDPETAAKRLLGDTTRPLLAGADRTERIREQLAKREAWYRKAGVTINGSGPPESVTHTLLEATGRLGT